MWLRSAFLLFVALFIHKSESYAIDFYRNANYDHHYYSTNNIPGPRSCQNLASYMTSSVSSLRTERCVILFSGPGCSGTWRRLSAGNYPRLGSFDDTARSYRACSDIGSSYASRFSNNRIRAYGGDNFQSIIADEPVPAGCLNLSSTVWGGISSITTPVCLVLYSQLNCAGGQTHTITSNAASLGAFDNQLKSLKLCEAGDSSYGSRPGQYKLKGKITKFEINSDEWEARQKTVTEYGELAQKAIFVNNGPAEVSEKFTVHGSRTDRVDVEMVRGLTEMNELSGSNTASKDFTQGFRNSLNKGFRNARSDGTSQTSMVRREESHSNTDSSHVTASVSAGFSGFGLSAQAGLETGTSNSNTRTQSSTREKATNTNSEITSEQNGFSQEEKNVETRIGEALTTGYQNALTNSRTQSNRQTTEKTKGFSIDKSISIPPCSRYVFSSFVKRTRGFPVQYTTYVEVTGEDVNGSPLSASEIRGKLKDLVYVRDKDFHTVIAKGSSTLVVDFSWFSTYKGEGETIEGCHERILRPHMTFMENFFNSDFTRNWMDMPQRIMSRRTTTARPRSRFWVDTEELI